ncbi:PAQR family membrane homeostasis protein TrhA [Cellulosilyticum lentocellum]|uniref:Channel protein, hemolysin III family n=1 Tax=Cellulosilyticum lentocellum (strain ATCC 49066 / DSM 5427 / NCIMB 11756 / RHM5) TaxID=642492 RepID=F2JN06_CELLD|nr:hemolysin III family protein [Cellulosilyticum lentocellum]ADZ82348.1 channel protein, hemolysin III family [Cellulosilyticum lentocellum DSM 5427]
MKQYLREPVNALTHLFGAVLSLIGTIFLLNLTDISLSTTAIVSIIIFGMSLVALYTTSGIYHLVHTTDAILLKLKKLDHSMIFVLIAGSYTPFCMLSLTGAWKWSIIITIWSLAIIGIILKVCWINMPRWLSTGFYIGMGWIALFALKPLYASLSLGGFIYLLLGGLMYTIGGIIYGCKKPNISPNFGFHEIFHIFVMLGSACHYWAILRYVL